MRSRLSSRKLRTEQLEGRLVLDARFSDLVTLQHHATGSNIFDPVEAVSADLDGDGDEDIAILSLNQLTWYENLDGQGTFGEQQLIGLLLGEVDGDGELEQVSAENTIVEVRQSPFSGTEGARRVGTLLFSVYAIRTPDFDGDGRNDLLLLGKNRASFAWARNESSQPLAGDFNSDGVVDQQDLDLVIAHWGYNEPTARRDGPGGSTGR